MRRAGRLLSSESMWTPGTWTRGIGEGWQANSGDSQGKKQRQHGNEAVKSHILAAKTVANIVKSSLVCGNCENPGNQARAYDV
jgi:hypothetical protein